MIKLPAHVPNLGDRLPIRSLEGDQIGEVEVVGVFPDPFGQTHLVHIGLKRLSIKPEYDATYPTTMMIPFDLRGS